MTAGERRHYPPLTPNFLPCKHSSLEVLQLAQTPMGSSFLWINKRTACFGSSERIPKQGFLFLVLPLERNNQQDTYLKIPRGAWVAQSNFASGHYLTVGGFKPRIGLSADTSEPGACFRFCISLSLSPSPALTRSQR